MRLHYDLRLHLDVLVSLVQLLCNTLQPHGNLSGHRGRWGLDQEKYCILYGDTPRIPCASMSTCTCTSTGYSFEVLLVVQQLHNKWKSSLMPYAHIYPCSVSHRYMHTSYDPIATMYNIDKPYSTIYVIVNTHHNKIF